MKIFFVAMVVFVGTFLSGDYLDISIGTKPNYNFEEYLFKDINITNTQKLEKKISYNELHLSGNFNNIIGFNYYKNDIASPDSFDSKEIYIGSDKTKFLGYQKDETTIHYGSRTSKAKTTKYTVYDVLTIEQNKLSSNDVEIFAPGTDADPENLTLQTGMVYRAMDYQKIILSSENLYNHVKENAIDGENYFNGAAISQTFSSMFRVYGVVIASYEQHDYSDGSANYIDTNGTTKSIFNIKSTTGKRRDLLATDGRFKGFGYGYKITAEAYWKDFSLFLTGYYKKTNLKNYYSTVKYPAADADDQVANVIALDKINFLQQYTSFGLRYRF